jgi:hypothetical protein
VNQWEVGGGKERVMKVHYIYVYENRIMKPTKNCEIKRGQRDKKE